MTTGIAMEIGGDHRGLFFSQCYSSTRREYSMQQSDITHTFTNRIKPTSVQENFGTGCKAKLQKRERNMSHHTKAVYCIQPHVNLSCSLSTSPNPLVYRKKKKKNISMHSSDWSLHKCKENSPALWENHGKEPNWN